MKDYKKIILASSSKNRKEIFDMIGFKYEVRPSNIDEISSASSPEEYVMDLSRDKAHYVASILNEDAIVIASDEVIALNGKIYEKPKSIEEAKNNLREMSGALTYAITGITIKDLYQDKEITIFDETEVKFKEISDDEIEWYLQNEPAIMDTCGYVVRGKAALFIESIKGDYNTLFGISASKVYDVLKNLGYTLADFEF